MIATLEYLSGMANRCTEALLAPVLAFLAGLLVIAVFSRYALQISMVNAVELTRIAFVWGCFLGATVALRRAAHVRVTFAVDLLPARLRPIGPVFANAAFLAFAALMVWHGSALASRMTVTTFPTLGISQAWLYLALPVSGGLMVLHSASGLGRALVELTASLRGETGP